jgi:ketosteroid isomerase-like protein
VAEAEQILRRAYEATNRGDFDAVAALVRYRGRGRGSGLAVDEVVAHVIELRDGLIARWRMFADVDKARRRFLAHV